MIKYDRLWETMRIKGITKYALMNKYGIGKRTLDRMKLNMPANTTTLDKLCNILKCNIEDIIEHTIDIEYNVDNDNTL